MADKWMTMERPGGLRGAGRGLMPWRQEIHGVIAAAAAVLACSCGHSSGAPASAAVVDGRQAASFKGYPNLVQKTSAGSSATSTPNSTSTTLSSSSSAASSPSAPATTGNPAGASAAGAPGVPPTTDVRQGDRFWPPRTSMATGPASPPALTQPQRPYVHPSTPDSHPSPSSYAPPPSSPPSRHRPPNDRPLPLEAGPRYTVVGVDKADVLNVRAAPGPKSPVVGKIPPDTRGVLLTGARQPVGPGYWREITYGDVRGWVNERFLMEERD